MAGFNPDAYLQEKSALVASASPAFNPDSYLREKSAPQSSGPSAPNTSGAMTALEGFGQGVGMGYLGQLQAKAEPITDRLFNLNPFQRDKVQPASWDQLTSNGAEYVKARDTNLKRQAMEATEHPYAYYGGQVAGAIASAPAVGKALPTAGLAAKGLLGRLAAGAATGAAVGAIQNPGDTEGQVDAIQTQDRIQNAKRGAIFGAAAQATGEVVGSAAKKVGQWLDPEGWQSSANVTAMKGAGAMKKDFVQAALKGKTEELGQTILNNKLLQPGDTVEDVLEKTAALRNQTGQKIGALYNQAEQQVAKLSPKEQQAVANSQINLKSILSDFKQNLASDLKGKVSSGQTLNKIDGVVEDLSANPEILNPKQANDVIRDLDGQINYLKRTQDLPKFQQALHDLRSQLRNAINKHIETLDSVLGSNNASELKDANKLYSNLTDIHGMAQNKAAAMNANRWASLTDYGTAVGGGIVGATAAAASDPEHAIKKGLIGFGGGLVANKIARTMGPGVTANTQQSIANALEMAPRPAISAALKNNPGLLAAITLNTQQRPGLLNSRPKGLLLSPEYTSQPGDARRGPAAR